MTQALPREMTAAIETALKTFPVVVVTGMRQVGKSTLLEKAPAFRRRRFVTLDDFAQLEEAQSSPETFLGRVVTRKSPTRLKPAKAREMLENPPGGRPLTEKQQGLFGLIASGGRPTRMR